MAETVEQLELLLTVTTSRVVLGEALDQLTHAGANLVGKVRSRRADQLVDLLDDRIGHGRSVTAAANGVGSWPCAASPGPT
jgi:hypothetical protein